MMNNNLKSNKIILLTISAIACVFLGFLVYNSFWFTIATPIVYYSLSKKIASIKIARDDKRFKKEFKDLLYSLSGSFSTGRHLVEALDEAHINLSKIYDARAPIMSEVNIIRNQLQMTGLDEIRVLEEFRSRRDGEDVADFVEMYKACRATGGDFADVLARGANIIAEKITIDREIDAITYQKKLEGRIIGAMPVVLLLFLNILAPDYIEPLYETLAGRVLMTISLALSILSFYLIERITNINV
ncbi:type II secretion system F family protein [Eubacteriales bacterium KG125]